MTDGPSAGPPRLRPVWAEIDLAAVRHNVALLRRLAGTAALCVVVKADGYGHGAVTVARAALEGGADWLAVALVEEGIALREAGIEAPVLVLSEPPADAMGDVVAADLRPTVYTRAGVRALAEAASASRRVIGAHVKVDTGMHRVGADPQDAAEIVGAVVGSTHLRFEGLWTHLAVADGGDEHDVAYTEEQLHRLHAVRAALADAGLRPDMVHAVNSAGTIAYRAGRLDMVRCGIAAYGLLPSPAMAAGLRQALGTPDADARLQPVLSLHARVSYVRSLDEGERVSYGLRYPLPEPSVVATIPIGYADGVPRRYFETGGAVLIGGRPRPLAGTVTMDQIMVDCGPSADVRAGDHVVLIGRQGDAEIGAWDWADTLGTIAYEVVCGIGARVPRVGVERGRTPEHEPAGGGRLQDRGAGEGEVGR